MRLVVTRPADDGSALAHLLREHGHDVLVEPMLAIRYRDVALQEDASWCAVLVTSANGVRALDACGAVDRLRHLPVYAVGRSSAEAALDAGFDTVSSADGDLAALRLLIGASIEPTRGPLLYAAGETVSGDLKAMLEGDGYVVDRMVLYDAVTARALSPELADAVRAGTVDGVLLFSPRTARVWADLVIAEGLAEQVGDVVHFCLSHAVADGLQPLGTVPCRIAAIPDADALLACIDGF